MNQRQQVGGDHYMKLAMQPFHFTLYNGWDAASHTILKYVSRHHNTPREKAIESLRKAMDCVDIIVEAQIAGRFTNTMLLAGTNVALQRYCELNKLADLETKALYYLEWWLKGVRLPEVYSVVTSTMVKNAIEDILIQRYGVHA